MKESTAQAFLTQQLMMGPVLDLYQRVKGESLKNEVIGCALMEDDVEDTQFMSIDMLIRLLTSTQLEQRQRKIVLNLSGCYLFDNDWTNVMKVVELLPRCEVVFLRGCFFRMVEVYKIRSLLSKLKFLDVNFCELASPYREDIFTNLLHTMKLMPMYLLHHKNILS